MTEAEFLEAINLHANNAITSFSLFITYIFGYITGAYLVGAKLRFAQVSIITALYIATSSTWVLSITTHLHSYETLVVKNLDYVPSPLWLLPWVELTAALTVSTLLASLYFMYDIRSNDSISAHKH